MLILEEEKDEPSLELRVPPKTDSDDEEEHDGSESKVMIEFGPTVSGSSATFETLKHK